MSDALAKRSELFSKLAQHNQQIAAYYQRRNQYEAAVARYLSVNELYPEAKESAESLYKAAYILQYDLKNPDAAIEIYTKIVEQKPDSPFAKTAQAQLDTIQTTKVDGED